MTGNVNTRTTTTGGAEQLRVPGDLHGRGIIARRGDDWGGGRRQRTYFVVVLVLTGGLGEADALVL